MTSYQRLLAAAAAGAVTLLASGAGAQSGRALSLEEALRLAESQSEAVRIAQAGVRRADGQLMQARSQYLPQLNGSAGYSRTLATQFSVFQTDPPVVPPTAPPVPPMDTTSYFQPCTRYLAPGGASEAQRVQGLEAYARCSSSGGGLDFSRAGFGAKNQYQLAANGSLTLYSGGRVQAQNRAARAGRRSADIELSAQRAQMALSVTEAYFDAVLAERLVAIAESSLAQTEGTLRQTTVARQVGNQSEFELLRARVTRDNQRPIVIQRQAERDIAHLRLKQLLNVPYTEPLRLTSDIEDQSMAPVQLVAGTTLRGAAPDTSAGARAPVRQLEEGLRAQEADLSIANSGWIPTVSLSTAYSRVAFGASGIPTWGNWVNNWTVSLGASFPLFTGGRIRGEQLVAQASLDEARARLDQTRELAALDARQSVAQLQQAEAALAASLGTAEEASRAYTIAEVRFREGVSTQLELSESRLLLEQARANRALSARNVQVARMRLALLRDLPLGAGGAGFGSPAGAGAMPGAGATGGAAPGGVQAPRTQVQRGAPTASTTTGTQGQ
ncbi:MAG: TolC family protein [Gemmatimonadaceae bacterium]|nr:TolC family protein [Gemmatimonadaceae bacterium]